jgi:hypothetical protein
MGYDEVTVRVHSSQNQATITWNVAKHSYEIKARIYTGIQRDTRSESTP